MQEKKKKVAAIVVAAGEGRRFLNDDAVDVLPSSSILPKQYRHIGGATLLEHALHPFLRSPHIDSVIVSIHPCHRHWYDALFLEKRFSKKLKMCYGGGMRQDSVYAGLSTLAALELENEDNSFDYVLIHDGVRPFVTEKLICSILEYFARNTSCSAVFPGKSVTETLHVKDHGEFGYKTPGASRNSFIRASTPQGFKFPLIFQLHNKYRNACASDDIFLCEKEGICISSIEDDDLNIKITTKESISYARYLFKEFKSNKTPKNNNKKVCIGNGFDVHAFSIGNYVTLGGIRIEHTNGLYGHSDADVVLHAIADALLGALGKGDIGDYFSPQDSRWRNVSSGCFMIPIKGFLYQADACINNIDIVIMAEVPKIAQHKQSMQKNISDLLDINIEQVNIKATTTEKLGFVGRKEGIACQAAVSITRSIV